ncbi:MAG: hypothetical protein H6613_14085 [Ignavibacteriales bacterium]|nr:hypothetical protein [Ignavibacteriales bacterium]
MSCLFEFNDIEISKLIDSKLLIGKSFFLWNISDEFEEFLGFDSILNISENGFSRLTQTSEKVNNLENKIFSNWENDCSINIPLFMGGIKFAPSQISERWKDYNDSDWFIPRFLFLKKSKRSFIVYNYLHNGKEESEHENEFDLHLEFLEKLFTEENLNDNSSQLVNPFHSNSVDEWKEKVDTALKKYPKVILQK